MNNVKTNRTFEQWCEQHGMDIEEHNFYRSQGWNAALESVVQEPAMTRKQVADHIEYRFGKHHSAEALLNDLMSAGRIPAPATGFMHDLSATEQTGVITSTATAGTTPQEGELTRLIDKLLNQESTTAAGGERMDYFDVPLIRRFVDDVKAAHQQALSAREQAVRGEYTEALVDLEKRFHALTLELTAEKLANEGKYVIGERSEQLVDDRGWVSSVIESSAHDERFNSGYVSTSNPAEVRHVSTLTPDEKAEAFVKWWCNEDADSVGVYADVLGWKELVTRQANGETIDQIYAEVEGRKG